MIKNILYIYLRKILNKLTNKVTIKTTKNKMGTVLLSYQIAPFIQLPTERITDPHTSYWECTEIVKILNNLGYDVDIINWWNSTYIPTKKYYLCIDVQQNLERLTKYLNQDCIKIMHIVGANGRFQNNSEMERLKNLEIRKKVKLKARRQVAISQNELFADFLEGFGNKTIFQTYSHVNKDIFPINESVTTTFDLPTDKDFSKAKYNFLWFGGGGAVHKGLDLVIEAISNIPEANLHIIGPIKQETDFMQIYKNELEQKNIFIYQRPKLDSNNNLIVGDKFFIDIANKCSCIIYPSCSEGTSGAVIQAMHASLIPIITPETGINEEAPAILIGNPTIESIKSAILSIINKENDELILLSRNVWDFARNFYTKNEFTRTYSKFLKSVNK